MILRRHPAPDQSHAVPFAPACQLSIWSKTTTLHATLCQFQTSLRIIPRDPSECSVKACQHPKNRASSVTCFSRHWFDGMESKSTSPLADLRSEIGKPSSVISQDTRAWLWLRSRVLDHPELRLSLQTSHDAHTGAAGLLRWCAEHRLYPSATFSRRDLQRQSANARRCKVNAFAAKMLTFASVICSPDADYEVKETDACGLGLFVLREVVLSKGQRLPGLTGWRRSMGSTQPTTALNSWMSNSMASKSADALIGPLCLGNHRCDSELEWARTRSTRSSSKHSNSKGSSRTLQISTSGEVMLRAKAGKTVRLAAGSEIRWNYGQIDFECKCPDELSHSSRKRKRMDSAPSADEQPCDDVALPAAKRPRTRLQTAAVSSSASSV